MNGPLCDTMQTLQPIPNVDALLVRATAVTARLNHQVLVTPHPRAALLDAGTAGRAYVPVITNLAA